MTKTSSALPVIVSVAIVAVMIFVGGILINAQPRSTSGVVTVSDYKAIIHQGDELILTSTSGKSTIIWHITYDGDQTVTAKLEGLFPTTYTTRTCGEGCSSEFDLGWFRHVTITHLSDSRVMVEWPWGWGYRRH